MYSLKNPGAFCRVKHDEMPLFQIARKQTELPIAENNFLKHHFIVSRGKIPPRFAVSGGRRWGNTLLQKNKLFKGSALEYLKDSSRISKR